MNDDHYSISHVARCFGLRVSTLRYYDQIGLLTPAGRRGTVRYYSHTQLSRLALIQRLHHHGLVNLPDTAALLADPPPTSTPSGRDILTTTIEELDRQITHLIAARDTLRHILECPADDPVRQCSYLRDELDDTVTRALEDL
ncbi:MerR family transcriptional regulator [Nocardia thraciensis]